MATSVEVGVYTVPSSWVDEHNDLTEFPYRRVVGLEESDAWSRIDPAQPQSAYDRDAAVLETIALPEYTVDRLTGFFTRFFVEDPRVKPGTTETEVYNCHRFGYWMRGTPLAQEFENPPAPDHVTEGFALKKGIPAGRHAVLGTPGAAIHSMVGLGEDNPECLQVLAVGGHMAIDSYDNVRAFYDPMQTQNLRIFI